MSHAANIWAALLLGGGMALWAVVELWKWRSKRRAARARKMLE